MTDEAITRPKPRPRGFAALSPERRREIAAKGGASVRPENRAFSRDNALASTAGAKGGAASRLPEKEPSE